MEKEKKRNERSNYEKKKKSNIYKTENLKTIESHLHYYDNSPFVVNENKIVQSQSLI